MNEGKDTRIIAVFFLSVCASVMLWPPLIALKVAGITDMHWALVLTGFIWIAWAVMAIFALVAACKYGVKALKRWHRRRKNDRRIIRQAKAAGVWNNPTALGGRALELYAWKTHRLKRKPGESNKGLRLRCEAERIKKEIGAEEILIIKPKNGAQTPTYRSPTPPPPPKPTQPKGNKLDELAWEDFGLKRLPGESDEQLRRRCHGALDSMYANAPDWRDLENE